MDEKENKIIKLYTGSENYYKGVYKIIYEPGQSANKREMYIESDKDFTKKELIIELKKLVSDIDTNPKRIVVSRDEKKSLELYQYSKKI